MVPQLWRKYIPVSSLITEVYGLCTQKARLQIIIVPGNPGTAGFYKHFMEQIFAALQQRVDVMAVSHLGHDPGGHHHGRVWNLDDQIQHKVDFLRQHVLLPGRPNAIVIGHSIGAYIALHALQRLAAHPPLGDLAHPQVEKVISLFPFFSADFTNKRQRLLRVLADWSSHAAVVASGLGRLPKRLQAWMIRRYSPADMDPHAIETTAELMSLSSVRNNLTLAWHEFRELDTPADWNLLRSLGSRAAVVCAPNDMWFPRHHYEDMLAEVAGVEEYWEESCSHAFCVSTRQCERVAQIVQEIVSRCPAWQAHGKPDGAAQKQHAVARQSASEGSLLEKHQLHRQPSAGADARMLSRL